MISCIASIELSLGERRDDNRGVMERRPLGRAIVRKIDGRGKIIKEWKDKEAQLYCFEVSFSLYSQSRC